MTDIHQRKNHNHSSPERARALRRSLYWSHLSISQCTTSEDSPSNDEDQKDDTEIIDATDDLTSKLPESKEERAQEFQPFWNQLPPPPPPNREPFYDIKSVSPELPSHRAKSYLQKISSDINIQDSHGPEATQTSDPPISGGTQPDYNSKTDKPTKNPINQLFAQYDDLVTQGCTEEMVNSLISELRIISDMHTRKIELMESAESNESNLEHDSESSVMDLLPVILPKKYFLLYSRVLAILAETLNFRGQKNEIEKSREYRIKRQEKVRKLAQAAEIRSDESSDSEIELQYEEAPASHNRAQADIDIGKAPSYSTDFTLTHICNDVSVPPPLDALPIDYDSEPLYNLKVEDLSRRSLAPNIRADTDSASSSSSDTDYWSTVDGENIRLTVEIEMVILAAISQIEDGLKVYKLDAELLFWRSRYGAVRIAVRLERRTIDALQSYSILNGGCGFDKTLIEVMRSAMDDYEQAELTCFLREPLPSDRAEASAMRLRKTYSLSHLYILELVQDIGNTIGNNWIFSCGERKDGDPELWELKDKYWDWVRERYARLIMFCRYLVGLLTRDGVPMTSPNVDSRLKQGLNHGIKMDLYSTWLEEVIKLRQKAHVGLAKHYHTRVDHYVTKQENRMNPDGSVMSTESSLMGDDSESDTEGVEPPTRRPCRSPLRGDATPRQHLLGTFAQAWEQQNTESGISQKVTTNRKAVGAQEATKCMTQCVLNLLLAEELWGESSLEKAHIADDPIVGTGSGENHENSERVSNAIGADSARMTTEDPVSLGTGSAWDPTTSEMCDPYEDCGRTLAFAANCEMSLATLFHTQKIYPEEQEWLYMDAGARLQHATNAEKVAVLEALALDEALTQKAKKDRKAKRGKGKGKGKRARGGDDSEREESSKRSQRHGGQRRSDYGGQRGERAELVKLVRGASGDPGPSGLRAGSRKHRRME